MLSLALFIVLTSSVRSSDLSWYPLMFPAHTTGGHHHRHTTHVVTRPVVHTRVIVIEEDDHRPSKSVDHPYGQQTTHGRFTTSEPAKRPQTKDQKTHHKTKARHYNVDSYSAKPLGGHTYRDDKHSQPDVRYSVLVSESPWKPLKRIPNRLSKGYLSLKQLGIDEETVAEAVQEALNEIQKEEEKRYTKPRYPTGIQDLIGNRVTSPPSPAKYRGPVLYEDDLTGRHVLHSSTGYGSSYRQMDKDPVQKIFFEDALKGRLAYISSGYGARYQRNGKNRVRKHAVNFNMEDQDCQCQTTYVK